MKTVTSNQKVVPQSVATLDPHRVRYGSYTLPAALAVKRVDLNTKDKKAVRFGSYTIPQSCR